MTYKTERFLRAAISIAYCFLFGWIFDIFGVEKINSLFYAVIVLAASIPTFRIYKKIRNRMIMKKVNAFLADAELIGCTDFVEKMIGAHPDISELFFLRLVLSALLGEYSRYVPQKSSLQGMRYHVLGFSFKWKMPDRCREQITKFDNVFALFAGRYEDYRVSGSSGKNGKEYPYNESLDAIDNILAGRERLQVNERLQADEIIDKTQDLLDSPYAFFRSAAALLLHEEYGEKGDIENGRLYFDKAVEYAPSDEVRYIIINRPEFRTVSGQAGI